MPHHVTRGWESSAGYGFFATTTLRPDIESTAECRGEYTVAVGADCPMPNHGSGGAVTEERVRSVRLHGRTGRPLGILESCATIRGFQECISMTFRYVLHIFSLLQLSH